MNVTISYHCPQCDNGDNEAEIHIDTPGQQAILGNMPEYCSPGEGAEWHVESAVCTECGFITDDAWFAANKESEIQEKAQEAAYDDYPDPPDDFGPDDLWDTDER
jgi:hypothetical protein